MYYTCSDLYCTCTCIVIVLVCILNKVRYYNCRNQYEVKYSCDRIRDQSYILHPKSTIKYYDILYIMIVKCSLYTDSKQIIQMKE